MSAARYRAWGTVYALGGVVGFSFRPVLIKLAYAVPGDAGHAVGPVTLLFLRMALALPFFAAAAWWLRGRAQPLSGRDWAGIAGLGFVGYYLASFLDFLGLQYVGAGVGRLILFLYPTLVLALSYAFLARRPSRRELASLAVSYAGIALVVSNTLETPVAGRLFLFGVLLVFGSALAYAVYLVAGSQMIQRLGALRFTAYTMLVSTVPVTIQFFALEPLSALELPGAVWGYAALMAVFSTVLPVYLVAEALRRIGASRFALIGAAGPVITVIAGAVGLDEPLDAMQAAGAVLVVAGVLLVSLKPAAQARTSR